MPRYPALRMPARTRWGLAVPSIKRISNRRLDGEAEFVSRTGASRFSVPQHTYVPPDQRPSLTRLYEAGIGRVRAGSEGRCFISPAKNDFSTLDIWTSFLTRPEWTDMWACAALPMLVMYIRGAKVARRPCLAATLYITSLVCTRASAACRGGSGPVTISC